MNSYSRLLYVVKPYSKPMIFAMFGMIVAAAAYLEQPCLIITVVDQVLDETKMFMLKLIVGATILIFLIRGFAPCGHAYHMANIAHRVYFDVRESMFNHLHKLFLSYLVQHKTGVIMSNLTNDLAALHTAVVDTLFAFIPASVTLYGSLVSMLHLEWQLALDTFIPLPVELLIYTAFGNKLCVAGYGVQGRIADIMALLHEVIWAIRVVQAFAREDFELMRFGGESDHNCRPIIQANPLASLFSPMVEFTATIAVVVLLGFGGYYEQSGTIMAGSLLAFLIYAIHLDKPVIRLSQVSGNLQNALFAADRVIASLGTQTGVFGTADAIALAHSNGDVEFKDVSLSYGVDKMARVYGSLDVQAGASVALVRPSGAGKTTVANFIPCFYGVKDGAFTIDGHDIKGVTYKS